MNTYYKYLSSDIDCNYLLNPTLLLSPPSSLNDPFENNIAKDIKAVLISNPGIDALIMKLIPFLGNVNDLMRQFKLEQELMRLSIVSFSETHQDILMWSHYGEYHQGVSIGYDTENIINHIKTKHPEHNNFIIEPTLHKINYRKARFDQLDEITGTEKIKTDRHLMAKLLPIITTTKSNDWMYEKEHRLIIPRGCANIIKAYPIFNNQKNKSESKSNAMNAIRSDIIKSKKARKGYTEIYLKENASIEEVESYIKSLEKYFRVLALMSIPRESIKSIYFGARSKYTYKKEYLDIIDSLTDYNNLKIYQYKVCDTRFDLISSKLDREALSNQTFTSNFFQELSNLHEAIKPSAERA